MEEEGRGARPQLHILHICFTCPMSFSASVMGRGFKEQGRAGGGVSSNSLRLFCGQRPVCGQRGDERLLGLETKTRDKENGSTESCLDPHMPFPVTRGPVTCTACRRWPCTKVDAFKNKP